MAYGITDESQLIDIDTIKIGCENFKTALEDFSECGKTVISASEICSSEALSVDDNSLSSSIEELGYRFIDEYENHINNADAIINAAIDVYNAQVAELNEYLSNQAKNN